MKKCVDCGYEGEEILICPKCGGVMDYPEKPKVEKKPVTEVKQEYHSDQQGYHNAQHEHYSTSSNETGTGFLQTPIGRKQFWFYALVPWIVGSIIVGIIGAIIGGADALTYIFSIAMFIFWIILQIKRLRDAKKSYWWMLLNLLTPLIALIVIGCFPSKSGMRY